MKIAIRPLIPYAVVWAALYGAFEVGKWSERETHVCAPQHTTETPKLSVATWTTNFVIKDNTFFYTNNLAHNLWGSAEYIRAQTDAEFEQEKSGKRYIMRLVCINENAEPLYQILRDGKPLPSYPNASWNVRLLHRHEALDLIAILEKDWP